jgi:ligand-binding sensor domain-containing protein
MSGVVVAFSCLLLLFHGASAATKVAARDVGRQAISLPEFKTNPNVVESEGNQISGVVRTIFPDRKGDLWFGTQDGVQRYDGTSLIFYDLRDELGKGSTVKAIAEDGAGHVWIGTTSGLYEYDGEYFTRYTVDEGLSSNDVWSVVVDSSGTVWVGTFEGACRLARDTFTAFPLPPATKRDDSKGVWGPNVVWSMTKDRAGNLWFVAESGVYMYGGGVLSRVNVVDQGTDASVSSVYADKRGQIWFSTQDTGLIKFDGETFTNVTRQSGLNGTRAGPLCEDGAGNIWFAVAHVGVYRFAGTSFTLFDVEDGLSTSFVFCIVEDSAGRIWCGGQRGAYRFDGTSFVNVTRNGPW